MRLLSVCCLFILFNACNRSNNSYNGYFCYNESSGISSLDPAFAKNQSNIWAVNQLYNRLVETGPEMQLIPSIARSWFVSEDRLTITFNLRTDVYFHDHPSFPGGKGRKLTAGDVEFSLRRLIDPSVASPGAWIFNGRVDPDKGFETLNDSVFRLHLQKPFIQMLGVLSNAYCSIVPREAVENKQLSFRKHPCGTGPFRFFLWEEGQVMIFKNHPAYFENDEAGNRLPYLQGVKISFLTTKAGEFLAFQQKELDFMNDIDPSFKDEVLTKAGTLRPNWQNRIQMLKHPYLNVEYLGILVDSTAVEAGNSPLKNKLIRQAVNMAIDRRKLMLYLRNSIGIPAEYGFIPPGLPGFDSGVANGYRYDPQMAKEKLNLAGYFDTKTPVMIKLFTIPAYADLANTIIHDLNAIGLHAETEVVQKSVLLTRTANKQAAFFRASWIADYPDAENFLGLFYSKYPAPPNYTRYENRAFDELYEACLTETDDSSRIELYKKMDAMVLADVPVVPLWYDEVANFVQPFISGFQPNALNVPDLRRVKKGKTK